MKTSLTTLLSAIMLVAGLAFSAGCAGTATRASTGEYIDDTAITAKVKTELARDDTVSALDVQVETFRNVVQLSGFVDNATQRDRAAAVARNVAGVREVKNNLVLKTDQPQQQQ